jgi:hypothetical protein
MLEIVHRDRAPEGAAHEDDVVGCPAGSPARQAQAETERNCKKALPSSQGNTVTKRLEI